MDYNSAKEQLGDAFTAEHDIATCMQAITGAARDAILMMAPDGRISYWNPAAERILGYTANEALGQNLHRLLAPPQYHAAHDAALPEFQHSGRGAAIGKTLELTARRKDGIEIDVALSLSAIQIGGRWHAVGILRDETEAHRQREELRASRERFAQVAETTGEIIWEIDSQGLFTYLSHACRTLLGYDENELVGKLYVYDLFPEAGRDDFRRRVFARFDRREPFRDLETQIVAKDGHILVALLSGVPILNADGTLQGYRGSGKDITERKQAEEALRQQQAFLRHIIDTVPAFICVKTASGRYALANRALADAYGTTVAMVEGHTAAEFSLSPEEVEVFRRDDLAVFEGRETLFVPERRITYADGSVHWLASTRTPLIEKDGSCERLLAVAVDITERKRAEDALWRTNVELQQYITALESSNQALEELNRLAEAATVAKSEFLANMSHEIRTPMTAILGYADLMLEENVGRATQEHVEVIKRNGKHLLEIINDILDLSKVEAGKMQIELIRCSPCQLVADVALLMRVRATEKQLTLKTELVYPLPETVLTDPLRLRQILVNLMGNAIKFTDHGEVRITTELTQHGDLPRLRINVTDTGIGINEEQVKNLFRPFTQVDSSSARKFGGTGLGLCVSKRLAEALGGDIEVHSNPGKGSTFSVTIDPGSLDGIRMLQEGQGAAVQPPPISTLADSVKIELYGRVLLAEDGADNRRLICLLLRKAGADVIAVENGQLAVETAIAAYEVGEPFDVILMDMQMPVMDGYTATRRLREWGYAGPIVALTAHAMDQDCQKCLGAGCDAYATKPINRQKLLTTVAHWAVHGQTHHEPPKFSAGEGEASTTMLPTVVDSHQSANFNRSEIVDPFTRETPDRINALDAQAKSRK